MNSFTLEATLDTKEANTIEFLGLPSTTVQHQISGTLRLHVQKAVQLKELSVAFIGETRTNILSAVVSVRTDAMCICRVESQVVGTSTLYQPGDYSFPFNLSLPGDLATTDSAKLKSDSLIWGYDLVAYGTPAGLFARRKIVYKPVILKRLHVPPSDTSNARYSTKRPDEFECSLYAPKFVSSDETKLHLSFYLHPYTRAHRVKEVLATAIQSEFVSFDHKTMECTVLGLSELDPTSSNADPMRIEEHKSLMKIDNVRVISNTATVVNPDQEEFTVAWGRECAVDLELDLIRDDILPSEMLGWLKIYHRIRFTIVFADPKVRDLVVMAPFQIGNILQELWSLQSAPDGLTPPDYGEDNDNSTLLDSNTSRVSRQELHRETYPEREPIVPDLVDDLPPVYEAGDEAPLPYSEK
ncbi:hypothetical protein BG011_007008 [Mortierella polycephala]|uniref:Arrestin-like N-terminal domain-containing protein n=1 Tax=Mortierella polycephala TaxID=41804 RepID=A0A9P6PUN6_9FUNG|nr:hypothetical protein BG011_007008 [Mortierella polycephala]